MSQYPPQNSDFMDKNQTSDAKPETKPFKTVPVSSGGWLRPFAKGDTSRRHLQVAGGRAGSKLNKRLAKLLRYSSAAYGARPKVILAVLETLQDQGKYKTFLETEFCELVALSDSIFEAKIAKDCYRDASGKWKRYSNTTERQGALELKVRMLELSIKLAYILHPELDHRRGAMQQGVQIVVNDRTVEVLPLDTAQSSNPSAQPVDLLPNLTSEKSSPPVGADGEREAKNSKVNDNE